MIWYSDVAKLSSSLIMKSPFFERNKLQTVANPLNPIISFYISIFLISLPPPYIIVYVSYLLALTLLMEGLCTLIYRLWCFEFPR